MISLEDKINKEVCKIQSQVNLPLSIRDRTNKPSSLLGAFNSIKLPKPDSIMWEKTTLFNNIDDIQNTFNTFAQVIDPSLYVITGSSIITPQSANLLRTLTLDFTIDDDLDGFSSIDEIEKFFDLTLFKKISPRKNPQIYKIIIEKSLRPIITYTYFRLFSIHINRTPFGFYSTSNNVYQLSLGFKETYGLTKDNMNYTQDMNLNLI